MQDLGRRSQTVHFPFYFKNILLVWKPPKLRYILFLLLLPAILNCKFISQIKKRLACSLQKGQMGARCPLTLHCRSYSLLICASLSSCRKNSALPGSRSPNWNGTNKTSYFPTNQLGCHSQTVLQPAPSPLCFLFEMHKICSPAGRRQWATSLKNTNCHLTTALMLTWISDHSCLASHMHIPAG